MASSEAVPQADAARICTDLEDLGAEASFGRSVERRGIGEVWQFFLETDWAVVRDTVIASALAAGIPAGGKLVAHAAKQLADKARGLRPQVSSERPGRIVIRDTRHGIELEVPSSAAGETLAWIKLLEMPIPTISLRWDPSEKVWTNER